ncbi:MAG TPA: acyl-CoA dehydrogenase family protein [Aeromicrobium sp.]|nr:acyl-CoA dehydrogenase family protein [Aeromicrobium sp.]
MTDLVPTSEQRQLGAAVRDLLVRRADSAAVRSAMASDDGFDRALWSTMCDQIGVPALAVPEAFGGAGFTLAETWVVLEQLGRSLAPAPLLASIVSAAALESVGGVELCSQVAAGTVTAIATGARWNGTVLIGSLGPVLWGTQADVLLVAAEHAAGIGLFHVDPTSVGVARTALTPLDPTTPFARIDLVDVTAQSLTLDATTALAAAHRTGSLATTALQVGCAQYGLDMTVAYAKEREQFGRPIGSFQALKHRLADLFVQVQMARSGSWAAVQAHVHAAPNADRLAAAAASYCADAAAAVAAETVQLHGGIAITWEHDAHLVLKRAHVLRELFDAPHRHRERLV